MPMTKPTSEQVTFLAAGSGAVQRTALDKFRETVSVKDFGAVGDNVADDTAAIQAAVNHCIATKKSLYFPRGTYNISTINVDFGGSYKTATAQVGFRMYGDGGCINRFSGIGGTTGTVLYYTGSSGTALEFNGRCSQMRIEGIAIYGLALQFQVSPPDYVGSTAVGLDIKGCINHSLRDVMVTGFETGLYVEWAFWGSHINCRFTQNRTNCRIASACNNIVAEKVDYNAGVNLLVIETTEAFGITNFTALGCSFESGGTYVRMNAEHASLIGMSFINCTYENSAGAAPVMFAIGYDSAGNASTSASRTLAVDITPMTYGGVVPSVMLKLNNCNDIRVGSLPIQLSGAPVTVTSTVSNVRIENHRLFGQSLLLPLHNGAYKKSLQRAANHNFIAAGNYLVHSGAINLPGGWTQSTSYVDGEPIMTITVPGSASSQILFPVVNLANMAGEIVHCGIALQNIDSLSISANIYNNAGTPWGNTTTGWSTSAMDYKGFTATVPATPTLRNTLRLVVSNASASPATFALKGVFVLKRDAGPVVTDAIDVLAALSGTVSCSPSATVNVPFDNALDYRVMVTPATAGITYSVAKSGTSFVITCSANASVDYVVIPRARFLQ